jgi:hypothetical protein
MRYRVHSVRLHAGRGHVTRVQLRLALLLALLLQALRAVVGATGFEPGTSSVSVNAGLPLC